LRWMMGEDLITHLGADYYDWDVQRSIGEPSPHDASVAAAAARDDRADILEPRTA